jgi:hypothetical protein
MESRSSGSLDRKTGERGPSDKGETKGWERLSHNRQIEPVDRQSLIEAKQEMENSELHRFDDFWETGRSMKKVKVAKSHPTIRSDRRLG